MTKSSRKKPKSNHAPKTTHKPTRSSKTQAARLNKVRDTIRKPKSITPKTSQETGLVDKPQTTELQPLKFDQLTFEQQARHIFSVFPPEQLGLVVGKPQSKDDPHGAHWPKSVKKSS